MISIIIPTLNEERSLPALLAVLEKDPVSKEIIVVDGGSSDGTIHVAQDHNVRILKSSTGRGTQIRAGAKHALGDILLFLHADTTFPSAGLLRISETLMQRPDIVGGNFRIIFDGDTAFSRWLTRFYARMRRLGFYYGDSGIFVRRQVYHAIGGMRSLAVMEDYEFARRLESAGKTCCIAEPPLITSSRRFERRHPAEIIYGWIKLHALFYLGISPERLAAIYATQAPRHVSEPLLHPEQAVWDTWRGV